MKIDAGQGGSSTCSHYILAAEAVGVAEVVEKLGPSEEQAF